MPTTAERDALAAKIFSREWARIANIVGNGSSKKRQQLRQRAEQAVAMQALRLTGASCATCSEFRKASANCREPHCATHSDFRGYTLTKATDLCLYWSAIKPST